MILEQGFQFRLLNYPSREINLTNTGVERFSDWFSMQARAIATLAKKLFRHSANKKRSRVAPSPLYIQGVSYKRGKHKQRVAPCKKGFQR